MSKAERAIKFAVSFLKKNIAWIIGHIFYKSRYLKGRFFDKYRYSSGWRWVIEDFFIQKIVGINRDCPFPVTFRATVVNWRNIIFEDDNINLFQKAGNYYRASSDGKIIFGKNCYCACNVGIVSANHNMQKLEQHLVGKDIVIGDNCWIGINCSILPGVVLGNHTIVGAGSVVTKSFPEGDCVIAGNPAKILKKLEPYGMGKGENDVLTDMTKCVGCALCSEICPTHSITMIPSFEGFSYPRIDTSTCIHCEKCYKNCPVSQPKIENRPLKAYAMKDSDTESRKKSASGGAWALMARKFIESGGVCAGVKLNENLDAVFDSCKSVSDIDKFRDSKYVQSDTNHIYGQIQASLNSGNKVFVTGLPCQIAALHSYLGDNAKSENLFLCDLVCHGAQSPLVFHRYISYLEKKAKKKIVQFFFRDKTNGWNKSNVRVVYQDGAEEIILRPDSEFFSAFSHNIALRKCCHKCDFKNFNSYADVTIGDYWGIQKLHPDMDDDAGISMLVVKTEKGEKLVEMIKDDAVLQETTVDFAIETHPKLLKSTPQGLYRNAFFKYLAKNESEEHFKKSIKIFTSKNLVNKVKRVLLRKLLKG